MVSLDSGIPANAQSQLTIPPVPISPHPFTLPAPKQRPRPIARQHLPHRTVTHNPDIDGCHPLDARSVIRSYQKGCLVQRYFLPSRSPSSIRP